MSNDPDPFGPDPLKGAAIINPSSFLPTGFTPAYADPADGQAAVDAVTAKAEALARQGQWNEALQVALSAVKSLATGFLLR